MKFTRIIYIIIGCVSLLIGTLGVVLPILPTVPFFMVAAYAFARSSKRLYDWFTSTKLYKKNLESYVNGKGMTWETKIRIISMVTLLMVIGFAAMWVKGLCLPCVILGIVWVAHIWYFVFRVNTMKKIS